MNIEYKGVTYTLTDEAQPTSATFDGSFHSAEEGETYWDEWACNATNRDGDDVRITWHFHVTKGEEPDADLLPFDDEQYITDIEYV